MRKYTYQMLTVEGIIIHRRKMLFAIVFAIDRHSKIETKCDIAYASL